MSQYDDLVGQRVTVVYEDRLGIENVTGTLKSVDNEVLGIETYHGITLIGRKAVVRLKLHHPVRRVDISSLAGGDPR